jgi:chaperonin cofactor prefoldin
MLNLQRIKYLKFGLYFRVMEEKIELNAFLNQLVTFINKRFKTIEKEITSIKSEIQKLKSSRSDEPLKEIERKVKDLEFIVNSLKMKSRVDKTLLKALQSEIDERRI